MSEETRMKQIEAERAYQEAVRQIREEHSAATGRAWLVREVAMEEANAAFTRVLKEEG